MGPLLLILSVIAFNAGVYGILRYMVKNNVFHFGMLP